MDVGLVSPAVVRPDNHHPIQIHTGFITATGWAPFYAPLIGLVRIPVQKVVPVIMLFAVGNPAYPDVGTVVVRVEFLEVNPVRIGAVIPSRGIPHSEKHEVIRTQVGFTEPRVVPLDEATLERLDLVADVVGSMDNFPPL